MTPVLLLAWLALGFSAASYALIKGDRQPSDNAIVLLTLIGPLAWPVIVWRYMDAGETIRRYRREGHGWFESIRLWWREYRGNDNG